MTVDYEPMTTVSKCYFFETNPTQCHSEANDPKIFWFFQTLNPNLFNVSNNGVKPKLKQKIEYALEQWVETVGHEKIFVGRQIQRNLFDNKKYKVFFNNYQWSVK